MRTDPRLFEAFVVLADELHFGRAAARLHVTQPALSQQIKRLERQLDVPLFARTKRHVELTEAGAAVLPAARSALQAATAAADAAAAHAAGRRGELRLGYSPGAHHAVEVALEVFNRDGDVRVRARQEPSRLLAEHVAAGDLDIAIGFCTPPHPGVRADALLSEPPVVVLPREHALAGAPAVHLSELAGERFALVDERDGPGYNAAVLEMCRRAGFEPQVAGAGDGPMAWERAVADGCVGITTRSTVHARARHVAVVAVRDAEPFELQLLSGEAREPLPAIARFCATLHELAAAGRLIRAAS